MTVTVTAAQKKQHDAFLQLNKHTSSSNTNLALPGCCKKNFFSCCEFLDAQKGFDEEPLHVLAVAEPRISVCIHVHVRSHSCIHQPKHACGARQRITCVHTFKHSLSLVYILCMYMYIYIYI